MRTRVSACLAATFAVLAGCSGGAHATFTPLGDAPSFSLANASVKEAVLHSFEGGAKDGSMPISSLIKVGKVLYGTSGAGGSRNKGTVFSISPDGTGFTVLHSFNGKRDGNAPFAGLTNVHGVLYGTTTSGGTTNDGTVFSITTAGTFTTLYSFKGGKADGSDPVAGLTNVRGTLYGATDYGGLTACRPHGCGTAYAISTSGHENVRYFFGSKTDDGTNPLAPLVYLGGKLYGTTTLGGSNNGTIFRMTANGKETVLYKFKNKSDGSCAATCYLVDAGGVLYGTAFDGGKQHIGSIFSITPAGAFKTLYSASTNGNNGGNPNAPLTNVAGTLYGTMSQGPKGKAGTVFSITTGGKLTTRYTFTGGNDGGNPSSRLLLDGDTLFGTTAAGGTKNLGTIYSVSGF